ncbi:MAG: CehA/McbA family metallohydrolase [Anaerolineales bacterium]|nr:CehA/McbA family metallohydrolase [Anaerolineales bacterium]
MTGCIDGPRSSLFKAMSFKGNKACAKLKDAGLSKEMAAALDQAPRGESVSWGIPFEIEDVIVLREGPITIDLNPTMAKWFVFLHTSDLRPQAPGPQGFFSPMRGQGQLGEHAADYIILYQDGTEVRVPIRRRFQVGSFQRRWGENSFEAVAHFKPQPRRASFEQLTAAWGWSQTRVDPADSLPWTNWLWAWENPHPDKAISGIRFEPVSGLMVVSGIAAGDTASHPLRWRKRVKACLELAEGTAFKPELNEYGLLQQIRLDLGQVISATPRLVYPNDSWAGTYHNQLPEMSQNQVIIEYTAHPEASFHLDGGQVIPISQVEDHQPGLGIHPVNPATQRVTIKAVERKSGKPVPVKLHVHGVWGEYLAPLDRHRIINPSWFEDYSVDFIHNGLHSCTYIPGVTTIDLPLGNVFLEVSKGFEIQPIRRVVEITADTDEIIFDLDRLLPWRENGWVTADTHVHFLSPMSALLEGAAEGVNVVNLLASQWGELMTNVGDFDGKTTWGSIEAGGDGEYLVRVGTENRQHVLGHISLLGYSGNIIAPMTTGGLDESALGDPIEILLTEWARQCKKQGGLVVLPHFPNPRAEYAASIVSGEIDAVEMTAWGNLYGGIDPYSLSDWYRFLNCGMLVAAVGGTDKMAASTAVGTVRTYARLKPDTPFSYQAWMEAVRRAETFVTYGPLLEFAVDGQPMGTRIKMSAGGGTVDVTWQVASVTVPISHIELIVNGEIKERAVITNNQGSGNWSLKLTKSSWLALLVRGHYEDQPEIILAHSSPVMVVLDGSAMLPAADAVTILEQIEGALAYLDTVGTRAEEKAYKRMRMVLTSAHRSMHNRLHARGYFHNHTPVTNHPEHG